MNPNDDILVLWFKRMRDFAGKYPKAPRTFLNYIKGKPCVLCSKPADHPHHIYGSYMSMKTSNIFVVPVCAKCHLEIDCNSERFELIFHWSRLAHSFILANDEQCTWEWNSKFDHYQTECKREFILEENLQRNGIHYCPQCGKSIYEKGR